MSHTLAFIGDIHGRLNHLDSCVRTALRHGATSLIQVGDFWAYDDERTLRKITRVIERNARQQRVDPDSVHLWFCDGNHEDYRLIDPDAAGPVRMSGHVTYMPRGEVAVVAGRRIGFFGGASSHDRGERTEGKDWWPQEAITATQRDRMCAVGPLDILVSHETLPARLTDLTAHDGRLGCGADDRSFIQDAVEACTPQLHVHGHYHVWNAGRWKSTDTYALNRDARFGAVGLLDTAGRVHPH